MWAACAGCEGHVVKTNVEVKHAKVAKLETSDMSCVTTKTGITTSAFSGSGSPSRLSSTDGGITELVTSILILVASGTTF